MEGPTPVSSLIHAATMVTAGVYLIARMHPLFELAPARPTSARSAAALTLLIAGTIALVETDIKRVIAYSTMSQIGYMIMGVSVGAYVAGLFHLMTHAFFKALLFMAAGSIIGAMAGEQSLDQMGGFRKAMPFTFGCFVIGGLALSGIPPFSGFFSKDEILAFLGELGGWHWVLYVVGYIGAFLTAIYTFRMIFRAFYGEPCAEARELEHGHLHHAEVPAQPGDRRGGGHRRRLPRPRATTSPSARCPMKVAMGVLAVLAVDRRRHADPGGRRRRRRSSSSRRSPTRRTRTSTRERRCCGSAWCIGTVLGARRASRSPTASGCSARARRRACASGSRALHALFVNKWYFDELIDAWSCGRSPWLGRFAGGTFERVLRRRGARRRHDAASCGPARPPCARVQSGFLRYYAALLLLGVVGVGLYFLISAADRIRRSRSCSGCPLPLSSSSALPLARAARAGAAVAGAARRARAAGAARSRLARGATSRGRAGLQYVTDTVVDLRARHPLQARPRRAERRPGPARRRVLFARRTVLGVVRASGTAPRSFYFHFGARRDGRARRLLRPGPGAVRRLLRPDADPVLLPDGHVGRGRARAGDDQARDLHARRLAADARRRGRDRRARRPADRRLADFVLTALAAGAAVAARRSGSSCASRPRSW